MMTLNALALREIKREEQHIAQEEDLLATLPQRRDMTSTMKKECAEHTRKTIRKATERITALRNGTLVLVKMTRPQLDLLWKLPVRNGTHFAISSDSWVEFAPAQLKNWGRIMEAAMILGFNARVCASILNTLKSASKPAKKLDAKECVLSSLETLNGTTVSSLALLTGYSPRSIRRALSSLIEEGRASEVRTATECLYCRIGDAS